MLLDKFFALGALFILGKFLYIVCTYVAEPDLYVVCLMVFAVAVWFIFKELKEHGEQFKMDKRHHEHHI